jgi:hypothetical protein
MVRSLLLWTVFGIMTLLAGAYVVTTFVYLTPPNPVKARWLPLINSLMHPLFAQNWHLFAPDPIRTNFVLSVRCRTRAGVSPWRDITQPMLERHHRERTSPMSRLLRVQQNAIRMFLGVSQDEWRQLLCRRNPRSPACREESPQIARQREIGLYLLRRSASEVCDRIAGHGRTQAVQLRILMHTPPMWSRRDRPAVEGSTRFVALPWAAYVSSR